MSTDVIDISPPLTTRIGVWPGDTPLSRDILCDIGRGDNITLSTLRTTVHLGAHADGPNHYTHPAMGIGERDLEYYIGPCHVVRANARRGGRVAEGDVAWPGGVISGVRHPRVLIRTDTFDGPEAWNSDFAGLEPALVSALAGAGVRTVGIDTPSVDLQDSKDLPAHAAFARGDMSIIEGLTLGHVEPGEYELIALPLRLIGFDASPVRAVLRPLVGK